MQDMFFKYKLKSNLYKLLVLKLQYLIILSNYYFIEIIIKSKYQSRTKNKLKLIYRGFHCIYYKTD